MDEDQMMASGDDDDNAMDQDGGNDKVSAFTQP